MNVTPPGILERLGRLIPALRSGVLLSLMTAVTTIILAILISLVVGTENAEHRVSERCGAYYIMALQREIVLADPDLREVINLNDYPVPDIMGIDCAEIFKPLEPAEIP